MQNQQYKLKNLKLLYLQERYKYITNIINLQIIRLNFIK